MQSTESGDEPQTHVVSIGGTQIAYWDTGRGTPILCCHGFPDSRRLWRHLVTPLARAGYRVIAPDLRGFGESARPPERDAYRLEHALADALGLLDALGVERAHCMGHDWGAAIGWGLAQAQPQRLLRQVSLSVGHPSYLRRPSIAQRRRLWYILLFQFEGVAEAELTAHDWSLFRSWAEEHPELERWLSDLARPGALTAALNWYRANARPGAAAWETIEWSSIEVPTLGVWSSGDAYLVEEFVTASRPWLRAEWRYERLEGASHWIPLDQPQRLLQLVLEFCPLAPE